MISLPVYRGNAETVLNCLSMFWAVFLAGVSAVTLVAQIFIVVGVE